MIFCYCVNVLSGAQNMDYVNKCTVTSTLGPQHSFSQTRSLACEREMCTPHTLPLPLPLTTHPYNYLNLT